MKIEMGESLGYSWLRHVKKCQIVQTNWKMSPKWEIKKIDVLREIMEKTNAYFESNYGYTIFKKNSFEQLLAQGEVDVLGISVNGDSNKIYALEVAFHRAGLNYGLKEETVSRVLKKYMRTAMCVYGYFECDNVEIIFAAPKINPAIMLELEPKILEINDFFESIGLRFKANLVANNQFNSTILQPILAASDEISDTSELFLRSYQMFSMFPDELNTRNNQKPKKLKIKQENLQLESALTDEYLKNLKIGRLVQETMRMLLRDEKITTEEISKMTEKEYSKEVFDSNIAVLKEVTDINNLNELKLDKKG